MLKASISWNLYDYGLQIMKPKIRFLRKLDYYIRSINKKDILNRNVRILKSMFISMHSILGWASFCMNYCISAAWHGVNQPVALLRCNWTAPLSVMTLCDLLWGCQWSSSGPLPSQQCSPLLWFQRTRDTQNLYCMDCHLLKLNSNVNILKKIFLTCISCKL